MNCLPSIVVPVAAALLLTACSADSSQSPSADGTHVVGPVEDPGGIQDPGSRADAEGVAESVAVLLPALGRGDGPRSCSLMARAAQDELTRLTGAKSCVEAVQPYAAQLKPSDVEWLTGARASVVVLEGRRAQATIGPGQGTVPSGLVPLMGNRATFELIEGRWNLVG
ncbi:hypothetical protein OO014_13175 [Intrasporangium calvum]|uniref:Lipoprotein n=1 Tax=Intrasporangium calvum TaxID=53358 RepID=A0ABT5GJ26_9MICO|nr:hypothetical protein [Intrasporangium calvum]MDC5698212.1 hypothetical protein [Intrasporangium calvum]